MRLKITVKPLPARGSDAVDVMIEVLEDGHWFLEVTRDFHLGENRERALAFIAKELERLV